MLKRKLRKKMMVWRREMSPSQKHKLTRLIMDRLLLWEDFQKAVTIFTYLSIGNEVDTWGLADSILKQKKRLVVPKVLKGSWGMELYHITDLKLNLVSGFAGIKEPGKDCQTCFDWENIDLFFIPGVAFDLYGNRIGRGGGYFDRFLAKLKDKNVSPRKFVALAYEGQIRSKVPTCSHDEKVGTIITEKKIYFIAEQN